jgi:hypothetical protein
VGKENCRSLGFAQDFLSGLVVSVNRMRLSLEKAAYVVIFESSVVGIRSPLGMTKGRAGAHLSRRIER